LGEKLKMKKIPKDKEQTEDEDDGLGDDDVKEGSSSDFDEE
jgi:hypothetical protein